MSGNIGSMLKTPDFIGLGAQRSGTSWIYACLFEHPEIYMPIKEVHFFSRERNWSKGREWYEAIFKDYREGLKAGEFSTSYLADQSTPERIFINYPQTKLIVSLRNPVDRAYSNYVNDIMAGTIKAEVSFVEALKNHPEYIDNGRYAAHLKNYLKYFNKDQILVLIYEESLIEPMAFIKKIYDFVGVRDFKPQMLGRRVNRSRVPKNVWLDRLLIKISKALRSVGLHKIWWFLKSRGWAQKVLDLNTQKKLGNKKQISAADRDYLESVFEPEIKELEEILGYEIKLWKKSRAEEDKNKAIKVLMISFDKRFAENNSVTENDTIRRHLRYVDWLRAGRPLSQLTVLTRVESECSREPIKIDDRLVIYPVPSKRWQFYWRAKKILRELIKVGKFDLVTTQTPFDDGWLGCWLKKKYGLPFNVQMRSSFLDSKNWLRERLLNRILNAVGKKVAGLSDTARVVSRGEKERIEGLFSNLRDKVEDIHPLVNLKVFELTGAERLKLEYDYFIFVGRLVREKNLFFLLRAFAKVNNNRLRLVMAGDGPLRPVLVSYASKLGIGERVVWLGNVALGDLREWYAGAVATVLPSFYEGFGKVVVESAFALTPSIVTPFVSAKELVKEKETGLVCLSFDNETELAGKMEYLLSNLEEAKEMGRRAKNHMKNNVLLSEDNYSRRLIGLWEKTKKCAE